MTRHPLTTRLREYISLVLPDAHGHQQKAVSDFVLALVSAQSCCQATLARFFDNFEAASKRLSRLLHNPRLATDEMARAHALTRDARKPVTGGCTNSSPRSNDPPDTREPILRPVPP